MSDGPLGHGECALCPDFFGTFLPFCPQFSPVVPIRLLHVEWGMRATNPHFFALSVAGRMGGADDIGTKSTWNMSFLVSHPR